MSESIQIKKQSFPETAHQRHAQDSNLQVISDQLFSRQLPHQPGHMAYIKYLVLSAPTVGLEPTHPIKGLLVG